MTPEEFATFQARMDEPVKYVKGGKNSYWRDQTIRHLLDASGLDPTKPTNWSHLTLETFEPIKQDRDKVPQPTSTSGVAHE